MEPKEFTLAEGSELHTRAGRIRVSLQNTIAARTSGAD